MKKPIVTTALIAIASAIASSAAPLAAPVFERVRPEQVPSGMEYGLKQPPVEDPQLFQGKRVAILASHGVEEGEITHPYAYLARRGAQVDVLVPGWTAQGIVASRFLKPTVWVNATGTFAQGLARDYDVLVPTGGAWNAQVVRGDADALKLVRRQRAQGRPIAAICAGSAILIDAGLARGMRLTGSPAIRTDLVNAGAEYADQPAVLRDGILTARSPNELRYFALGLKKLLTRRQD